MVRKEGRWQVGSKNHSTGESIPEPVEIIARGIKLGERGVPNPLWLKNPLTLGVDVRAS